MSMETIHRPQVGIAVIICNDKGQVLMSERKNKAVGSGTWQFPGGHLEMYESFEGCALREVGEEVSEDIKLAGLYTLEITNNPWPEQKKHYITVFMGATYRGGSIAGMNGHGPWAWIDLNDIHNLPLFEAGKVLTPQNIVIIKYKFVP